MKGIMGMLTCTLLAVLVTVATGCGKGTDDKTSGASSGSSSGGGSVDPRASTGNLLVDILEQRRPPAVDIEKLKTVFPEKVAGMDRGEVEGQVVAFGDVNTPTANATYTAGGRSIKVVVSDMRSYGVMPPRADEGLFDRKRPDGDMTVQGFSASAVTNKKDGWIMVSVFVGRFLVNAKGDKGVTIGELKKVLSEIDLAKLNALK